MKNRLHELEWLLEQLENSGYSKVIISPEPDLNWHSLQDFSLSIKGSSNGAHYFGSVRISTVELIGPKEDFRKLGLLLIMRGLTYPKEDIFVRLLSHDKSLANAVMFNGVARPPDIFDLVPNSVIYHAADISSSYPRNDGCDACASLATGWSTRIRTSARFSRHRAWKSGALCGNCQCSCRLDG